MFRGVNKLKNIWVIPLCAGVLIGCNAKMTEQGSQVRVIDGSNSDFLVECEFIGAKDINEWATWSPKGYTALMRNDAAEMGADAIVMVTPTQMDMYRCSK